MEYAAREPPAVTAVARLLGSRQSRIAKMAGDAMASIDLRLRTLLATRTAQGHVARAIDGATRPRAA